MNKLSLSIVLSAFVLITNAQNVLQIEGKKQMAIEKFLKGNRINNNFSIL